MYSNMWYVCGTQRKILKKERRIKWQINADRKVKAHFANARTDVGKVAS